MISILEPSALATPRVACCDLAGYATGRATAEAIPAMRKRPSPLTGEPFPLAFWKHADDQTLVGLAAVFDAIEDHGLDPTTLGEWGVLAAPRFLGRVALAAALNRFTLEGAWGISPHLIPHRSLHSISGTVSQALKIQGPNFGVGGGPTAAEEALVVAAAMLTDKQLPGVWVVMTGYEPELAPTDPEASPSPPTEAAVTAVALALVRDGVSSAGLRLRIGCGTQPIGKMNKASSLPAFSLRALREVLTESTPSACWRLQAGWAALEMTAR